MVFAGTADVHIRDVYVYVYVYEYMANSETGQ